MKERPPRPWHLWRGVKWPPDPDPPRQEDSQVAWRQGEKWRRVPSLNTRADETLTWSPEQPNRLLAEYPRPEHGWRGCSPAGMPAGMGLGGQANPGDKSLGMWPLGRAWLGGWRPLKGMGQSIPRAPAPRAVPIQALGWPRRSIVARKVVLSWLARRGVSKAGNSHMAMFLLTSACLLITACTWSLKRPAWLTGSVWRKAR